jgi:hypothetical protein
MRKQLSVLVLAALVSFSAIDARAGQSSARTTVTWIQEYGSNWANANKGGFSFRLASMPSDIDYFIVRPGDVSVKNFLSTIQLAVTSGRQVIVEYNRTNATSGGKYEGDIVSLQLF